MARQINLSFCTYQNGGFDVIVQDVESGEEITFSGEKKLSKEQFEIVDKIAPACVFTRYERITPDD